jgi:hypothetical protein
MCALGIPLPGPGARQGVFGGKYLEQPKRVETEGSKFYGSTAHLARDQAFREALMIEAAEQLLARELETGKAVLRDYINATVGFEKHNGQVDNAAKPARSV